jgi:hypothetical protein
VIKGGIAGPQRIRLGTDSLLSFDNNRFNYCSTPDKLLRLILVVFEQTQQKRAYQTVMVSSEFIIIDKHKALLIENRESLKLYFELVVPSSLDKSRAAHSQKVGTLSKHKIVEEMSTFENYLTKKNKKIWSFIYAAYKYSHIVDLYFYNPQNRPKK